MKKFCAITTFLLCFSAFAQQVEMLSIDSKVFGESRKAWIYLPPSYFSEPTRKFEVVYVFDAQAVQYFDITHSTLQFVSDGVEMIVVGVVASYSVEKKQNRNTDFLPTPEHPDTAKRYDGYVGNADNFLKFVTDELVTTIETNYRTLPMRIGIAHSNGGTFLAYSLINKPELFDVLFLISPNFEYDHQNMIKKFRAADPELWKDKYVFLCHANEGKSWDIAIDNMINLLKSNRFKENVEVATMNFSQTENHSTVFPIGLFHAFKTFFDYQFGDSTRLIAYYKNLAQKNIMVQNAEVINQLAYNFYYREMTNDAIAVINYGIESHPLEHNLYDSRGEFLEKIGKSGEAKKSYLEALQILKKQRAVIDTNTYNTKLTYYKSNLERLDKKLK